MFSLTGLRWKEGIMVVRRADWADLSIDFGGLTERGVICDFMALLSDGLGVASGREVAVSSSAACLTRLAGPASRFPRDEGRGSDVDEDDEGRSSSALEGERLSADGAVGADGLSVASGLLSLFRKAEG